MSVEYDVDLTDLVVEPSGPFGSRTLLGVLGIPRGDGPWPGIVMVHEAFGVTEVMRRQVSRLAAAGFIVLMPDLFSDGGARRCLTSTFRTLMTGEGRAFVDIESARQALIGRGDCTGRVGVIGFCMGGGFALMTATTGFEASSVNYGMLPKDIDAALRGACPIVGSYGADDRSLRGATATLETALTRHGVPHDVKEYPGAGHSFLNDGPTGPAVLRPLFARVLGAAPNPEAATDAWQRIDAFFAEHLAEHPA